MRIVGGDGGKWNAYNPLVTVPTDGGIIAPVDGAFSTPARLVHLINV